jgi:signal peptidase I
MLDFENVKEIEKKRRKDSYMTALCITTVAVMILLAAVFRINKVSGVSMNPTLEDGDILVCAPVYLRKYERGDIVVIQSSALNESIVKRVIGKSGDTVLISTKNDVVVNGEILKEDYLVNIPDDYISPVISVTVPEGYVFVLGDNRPVSNDSRYIGCIPESEVKSVVLFKIR